METIHKYRLDPMVVQQTIEVTADAEILCMQLQHGGPCVWARVDTEEQEKEQRTIFIYETGRRMHECAQRYLGTYQQGGGARVFHVFEKEKTA